MPEAKKYVLHTKKLKPSSLDYEKYLNEEQKKVVFDTDGPCLVLAGAGSGKTRTLIFRLAWLVESGVPLQNIFLATFTNKAAREMLTRAENLLKTDLKRMYAGTFHHIANIILRKWAHTLGYENNFTILDREDAKDVLDDCIQELKLNKKDKLFPKLAVLEKIFNLSVNSLQNIDHIIYDKFQYLAEFTDDCLRLFEYYKKKKKKSNLMDYDDMLYNLYLLLKNDKIRDSYSQKFLYIMVDEYQDTNKLQFMILKSLSTYHKNILVVGDDSQSIYSFRAAEIRNILDFPKEFKNTRIFKLELNYRSTPQILNLANSVIVNNQEQFHKVLKPTKSDGVMPWVSSCRDTKQEAHFVVQKVLEHVEEKIPLREIAVLFRSHFQSLDVEMELIKHNIPYIVRGGLRFFEQAHIKDLLSYLKFTNNTRDELAFKRSLKLHKGLGPGYAQRIWNRFQEDKYDFGLLFKQDLKLPQNAKMGFEEFKGIINRIDKEGKPSKVIEELLEDFYKDYCYLAFENPRERILDIQQLIRIAEQFQTIEELLRELSFYESFRGEVVLGDSQDDVLVLSTIHQAKGLEWQAVFIIGCVQGQFPHPESLTRQEQLEEERRLFYVASTRAKSYLYVSFPQLKYDFQSGAIVTKRSQFVEEIPENLYEEYHIQNGNGTGYGDFDESSDPEPDYETYY